MRFIAEQAQEILPKIDILVDEPDLLDSYEVTKEQVQSVIGTIPYKGI